MTEAEWLAGTDSIPMLDYLKGKASERKLRLVACGCMLRLQGHLKDERSLHAIETAERFADGLVTKAELKRARQAVRAAQEGLLLDSNRRPELRAYEAVALAATEKDFAKAILESWVVARLQATGVRVAREPFPVILLRDVFGNPFHPITIDLEWRTSNVVAIARGMYESRDFSTMPILGDALQDAGCENEDVLNHCRGEGLHVRGCWVVDLILSKS